MARKLRLEYAGASYHVINRGNYRQNVFERKVAAEAFERCLGGTCMRCGWVLDPLPRDAGAPFQGRYKALHVEPGAPMAQVANYIHLNPVRPRS